MLGIIAAGCDGDDELTLEEYFGQVETLADAQTKALGFSEEQIEAF